MLQKGLISDNVPRKQNIKIRIENAPRETKTYGSQYNKIERSFFYPQQIVLFT